MRVGGFSQCASSNNSTLRDFILKILGIGVEVSSFCNYFLLGMDVVLLSREVSISSKSRYSVYETSFHPCSYGNLAWNCWTLPEMKQTEVKQEAKQDSHHWAQRRKAKFGVRAAGCVMGCWWGECSRNLVLSLKLSSSTWVGLQYCRGTQKYCYEYSLSRNQDRTKNRCIF